MKVRPDVLLVVAAIALVAFSGLVGIIVLNYAGRPIDSAINSITSGAAGALFAMLARTTASGGEKQ